MSLIGAETLILYCYKHQNAQSNHCCNKIYFHLSIFFYSLHVFRITVWWLAGQLENVSQLPWVVDGVESKELTGGERLSILNRETLPGLICGGVRLNAFLVHSSCAVLHFEHCSGGIYYHTMIWITLSQECWCTCVGRELIKMYSKYIMATTRMHVILRSIYSYTFIVHIILYFIITAVTHMQYTASYIPYWHFAWISMSPLMFGASRK